jgi:ABC-type transport system involved in multi-copper enzyme maturation permease subunit
VRLLRAEVSKLSRPLSWGVAGSAALFCVLLAIGGTANATSDAKSRMGPVPSCAELRVPVGPACARTRAVERSRIRQIDAGPARVAAQLNPVAAGAEAAGLMASLPGALALALLAGGHIGAEWSGRTMKNLLTQHGRRWQVLGAKLVSLWLAGIGLIAACWAALAVAGPVVSRLNHLPDPHESLHSALTLAGSQVARSLLVLAAFAAIGLLAAVVTRNTIGTMATTAGVFVVMLVAASLPGLGRWTPATWVQGWMGFPAGLASITSLPTNFWSRFINGGGSPPSHLLGLAGLAALLVACTGVAARIFSRADVSG